MTRKAKPKAPEPEKTMLAIKLPESERGVGLSALARFDKAQRALANPMTKPRAREEHARTVARIEAAPKEAADKAWQDSTMTETMDLAEARGEVVDKKRRRILSRDPLDSLSRHLTIEQQETGKRCRDCYEARAGDVGSQMGAEQSGGGHDNNRFVGARYLRAAKTVIIGKIERAIAVRCLDEPASLQMFRAVLSEGHFVSSFGEGRALERHSRAFARALDVAADVFADARTTQHIASKQLASTTA